MMCSPASWLLLAVWSSNKSSHDWQVQMLPFTMQAARYRIALSRCACCCRLLASVLLPLARLIGIRDENVLDPG